jgi:L-histidine Nalpha-methyltransferase
MNNDRRIIEEGERIRFRNLLSETGNDQLVRRIMEGLCRDDQKAISSMFFYDAVGSKLYERITELPEYYLPRLEKSLIREMAALLAGELNGRDIVELGSGDCSKISLLIENLGAADRCGIHYIPMDFSESAIRESAKKLSLKFPELEILGLVGDFLSHLDRVPCERPRLFVFFGSTIGNLEAGEMDAFFSSLKEIMKKDDMMLLGLDMIKDRRVLENAYNDSQGVTAQFNRNVINVVNRLLDCSMSPDSFEHVAFFNDQWGRIEMHLRALEDISIEANGIRPRVRIKKGELIHTENSYKFTPEKVDSMLADAGFAIRKMMRDQNGWFSLVLMTRI